MSEQRSNYKNAVKAARQRLLSGYGSNSAGGSDKGEPYVSKERAKFLKQVLDIVNSDDVVLNPIMRLADKKLMEGMSESERSRYVLELSREYLEEREFIEKNALNKDKLDELLRANRG